MPTEDDNAAGTSIASPPLKRRRIAQACNRCSTEKKKCNGARPSCASCARSGSICSYRPNTKRRGLAPGYVRLLETLLGMVIQDVTSGEVTIRMFLDHCVQRLDARTRTDYQQVWKSSDMQEDILSALPEIEFLDERDVEKRRPERAAAGRFHSAGQESSMNAQRPQACSWTAPNLDGSSDDVAVHDNPALQPSASIHYMPQAVSVDIEPNIATEPIHSPLALNANEMDQPVNTDPTSHLEVLCSQTSHAANQHSAQGTEQADDFFQIHDVTFRDDLTLRLPDNANHLVDMYFTYTHTWLPVVDRAATMQYFSVYSSAQRSFAVAQSSQAAVLWALLAHSSTQCATNKAPTAPESLPQEERTEEHRLYIIARNLTYRDHLSDLHQAQALLLLSMVELKKGRAGTAWVMVGHATRIAIEQSYKDKLERVDFRTSQMGKSTLLGCFVLDTLISACLQRSPQLRSDDVETSGKLDENGLEEWDFWRPVSGLSAVGNHGPTMQSKPARVQSTFNKLCELISIVNDKIVASSVKQSYLSDLSLIERLRSWSQQFPALCDNENDKFRDKGLEIPNAMHLHACFYSTSIFLQQQHFGEGASPSLEHAVGQLASQLDDFEKRFGPCAVPATCRLFTTFSGSNSHSDPQHPQPVSRSGQIFTSPAPNNSTVTLRSAEASFVEHGDIPVFPSISPAPAISDLRRPHQAPVIDSISNPLDIDTRPAQQPLFLPQFVEGSEANTQPRQVSSLSNQGSNLFDQDRNALEHDDPGTSRIGLGPVLSETSTDLFQTVDTLNDGMFQEMLLEYERQNNESSEDFWRNLGYFEWETGSPKDGHG